MRDLFTFGCPRIGDKEFASYPNSIREFQRSWRFVNSNDLFAKHPTRWFKKAYYHLDTMVHINAKTIEIGKSELGSMAEPKMASTGEEGEAIGLTAHSKLAALEFRCRDLLTSLISVGKLLAIATKR